MVGDAVWPKYVEDCPYRVLMENVQLLNDVILYISLPYSGTEVTQLLWILSLLSLLCMCDLQTGLRLVYALFAIDVFI